MVSREIQEKFNSAFDLGVAALGSTVISAILLFTPGKMVGYIGMGAGIGSFVASSVAKRKLAVCGNEMISDILKEKNKQIVSKTDEFDQLTAEHNSLKTRTEKVIALGNEALALQEQLQTLQKENTSQTSEIKELKEQLSQSLESGNADLKSIKDSAKTAIQERYDGLLQALKGFTKRKDYQLSSVKVMQLKNDADEILERYFTHLAEVSQIENICELLHGAIDELANAKIRAINSYQTLRIADLIKKIEELEQANQEWDEANLVPREALEKVRRDCISQLKEFHITAKSEIENLSAGIAKHEELIPLDDEFFQDLRNQIKKLEQNLAEERKPLRFIGTTEQSRIGNALIDYYLRSGIRLDAIEWMGTELGYKLMFHFGRNGVYISPDQLHENNAREQIKAMSSSLSLPEFKQSERGGHLYLEIQQRLPQKKDNSKEVARNLLDPDKATAKIIASLADKPTIRIMGATGEGKGVMARYLLNRILELNNWYTRLHDPQDGSSEDYWGIAKVSRRGSELEQALLAIHNQMIDREANGWEIGTLDILDEIDTHLEKQTKKDNFIDLISRIRHLGMKLILIGQNPKVGRAGFEWSDMQQMACIYMGASAFDAIITNPQLQPKKDKLTKEYTQISEYFEELNEGLDGGEKHLFGLVVIPGKTPFWVELPRPDSIEVNCNQLLLAKEFAITDSLTEFINGKNDGKQQSPFSQTNSNSSDQGTGKAFVNQELQPSAQTPDYGGSTAQAAQTTQDALPTCKRHPVAKLRECKDGRFYCPSCKKKLSQSELEYR